MSTETKNGGWGNELLQRYCIFSFVRKIVIAQNIYIMQKPTYM